jgi:hypothetical protein
MAGINGKNLTLPPVGDQGPPNVVKVARCRVGYGDSGRTAGGASDGCHKWLDTAGDVVLFLIPAVSSDRTTDGLSYGGLMIHDVWSVVKVAFTGATACSLGDCAGDESWAEDTDVAVTSTGVKMVDMSSAFAGTQYGPETQSRNVLYISTDADQIQATFTGDATAGVMDVYVMWSMVDMDNLANTDWPDS